MLVVLVRFSLNQATEVRFKNQTLSTLFGAHSDASDQSDVHRLLRQTLRSGGTASVERSAARPQTVCFAKLDGHWRRFISRVGPQQNAGNLCLTAMNRNTFGRASFVYEFISPSKVCRRLDCVIMCKAKFGQTAVQLSLTYLNFTACYSLQLKSHFLQLSFNP